VIKANLPQYKTEVQGEAEHDISPSPAFSLTEKDFLEIS
jgi:hypothetical protein